MPAMTLNVAGCGATITPVTTGTTKLFRIVNLQEFAIWMADKCTGETIRFFPWSIGRQICRGYIERFANADVTNFASIDDVVLRRR